MNRARLPRSLWALFLPLAPSVLAALAASCGSSSHDSQFVDGGDDGTQPGSEGGGDTGGEGGPCLFCAEGGDGYLVYGDFPPQPILDMPDAGAAAPPNAGQLFGGPSQGAQSGGPCLIEPEVGSLYPKNWLRPRFSWIAANGENLFELRLHVANQSNDLVVYTTQTQWTMPKAMWGSLSADSADQPMTVSVRGGVYSGGSLTGEALGSKGALGIAPVAAPGTIVYWSIIPSPGTTALKGFAVGDESVTPVLTPSQVQESPTTCLGCHNATPDGDYASFSTSDTNWGNGFADIRQNMTGQVPPWLGAAGKAAVESSALGIHTFSTAHWAAGDRIEVAGYAPGDNHSPELTWIDLEAQNAPASGTIARNGDSNYAGAPSWSHDGKTIAYVSTNAQVDGRLDDGPADIWTVPYNNKAGGTATALAGASSNGMRNYYPAYSPDDKWIAFDQSTSGSMYNNAQDELYVVPSAGGTATRLSANDPPACSSKTSPGVTNSWPKWSPQAQTTTDGRTFYWIVFSSIRDPGGNPQLYVTPVVVDGAGKVTTYHALYLWNQPSSENNHTPAWDNFQIPPPGPQ
ncbi:MAG TPA: hypothetical protein VF765_06275 [Polyangiaceae bacterium]